METQTENDIDITGDWNEIENETLRWEIYEMENKIERWKALVEHATEEAAVAKERLAEGMLKWREKYKEENTIMYKRASSYLDIILEYEKIIMYYIEITNTNLTTTTLKKLREKGGLLPE
jgi:predicted S18 family serine protease